MEKKRIIQVGNVTYRQGRDNPNDGRVYSPKGIAPSLNCMEGGNRQPLIIVRKRK